MLLVYIGLLVLNVLLLFSSLMIGKQFYPIQYLRCSRNCFKHILMRKVHVFFRTVVAYFLSISEIYRDLKNVRHTKKQDRLENLYSIYISQHFQNVSPVINKQITRCASVQAEVLVDE